MTDILDYIAYFETVATEHPGVNDFYMMDINEPLAALRSDIRYPALILTSLSGRLVCPNADNCLDEVQGGFIIIDHLESPDDFRGEVGILKNTKSIGLDIIARMVRDARMGMGQINKNLAGFSPENVTYEMVGPVFDNDFGFIFSFKILLPISLMYHSKN